MAVSNIPKNLDINYMTELESFLERKLLKDKKTKITKINLAFDLTQQRQLEMKKKVALKEKKNALLYLYKNDVYPNGITEKILEDKISKEENELEMLEADYLSGRSKAFAGWAFVSLQSEAEKDNAVLQHKLSFFSKLSGVFGKLRNRANPLVFHGNQLIIEEAPEPTDVNWDNLRFTPIEKLKRRLVGYFIMFLAILVGASAIFGLMITQQSFKNETKISSAADTTNHEQTAKKGSTMWVQILGLLVAIAIPIVNLILVSCIESVAK